MIAVALVGIVLAVMGIKKQKSALSVISLVAASLSAGVIITLLKLPTPKGVMNIENSIV